jgi:pyruvate/2-oxoglutarate dehydrogenase complex dihydrolipoamide acyltransferase (E2) component
VSSSTNNAALVPVTVPELDSRTRSLQLVQWLVDPGAPVHAGDRIAELLVAGVVFHLPSPTDGVISQVAIRAHSRVGIGDVLGWIAPTNADS